MNTAVNVNVVHESEAQRQYARVKLPAKIQFRNANREACQFDILDVSAGGFSFAAAKSSVRAGDHFRGRILFQIDSIGFALDVSFQVKFFDSGSGRAGCEFQSLGVREISALRYLITSYLGGELVTLGDMLNTLQRDNFAKARKQKDGGVAISAIAKLRALTFSLGIFAVGIVAFSYAVSQLYDMYFVTRAESAMVSVPTFDITMPREGSMSSLVATDGKVAKGAPVATFSASLLDVLKGHLADEQITPERVTQLSNTSLQGTMTSPCDCVVSKQLVADGQYAAKGIPVMQLTPVGSVATIDARFAFKDFASIQPGTAVSFVIAGDSVPHPGKVVAVNLRNDGLASDIRVAIQPEQPLDASLAGRPVSVSVAKTLDFPFVGKVMAAMNPGA